MKNHCFVVLVLAIRVVSIGANDKSIGSQDGGVISRDEFEVRDLADADAESETMFQYRVEESIVATTR